MLNFQTIDEAIRGIIAYLISSAAKLPTDAQAALQSAQASSNSIHTIMTTIEAMYAFRDYLDDNGRMLVVSLVQFAMPSGWYEIRADNRGPKIQWAMMRDSGMEAPDGFPWPDPSNDPEVAFQFRPINVSPAKIDPAPVPSAPVTGGGEDATSATAPSEDSST